MNVTLLADFPFLQALSMCFLNRSISASESRMAFRLEGVYGARIEIVIPSETTSHPQIIFPNGPPDLIMVV
jgi:hypothetical protein